MGHVFKLFLLSVERGVHLSQIFFSDKAFVARHFIMIFKFTMNCYLCKNLLIEASIQFNGFFKI